jgi:hypothetical protein
VPAAVLDLRVIGCLLWHQAPLSRLAILGHATVSFTDDVYVGVAEEMEDAAAEAIAAFVPRRQAGTQQFRASNVPAGGEK